MCENTDSRCTTAPSTPGDALKSWRFEPLSFAYFFVPQGDFLRGAAGKEKSVPPRTGATPMDHHEFKERPTPHSAVQGQATPTPPSTTAATTSAPPPADTDHRSDTPLLDPAPCESPAQPPAPPSANPDIDTYTRNHCRTSPPSYGASVH